MHAAAGCAAGAQPQVLSRKPPSRGSSAAWSVPNRKPLGRRERRALSRKTQGHRAHNPREQGASRRAAGRSAAGRRAAEPQAAEHHALLDRVMVLESLGGVAQQQRLVAWVVGAEQKELHVVLDDGPPLRPTGPWPPLLATRGSSPA